MLARYFPDRVADVVAHGAPGAWASQDPPSGGAAAKPEGGPRMAVVLPADDVPTVAVLGAVGPDKGARRLERLVALARERGARVRFVLIGYTDVLEEPWQSDDAVLTVHGAYAAVDLPDLLAHYRARLVVFPSAGPETFSFTLSESWASGLPVVVPPFGALAERLGDTGAGWAWTDDEWRSEDRMLDRILQIVAPDQAGALAGAARRARELALPTLATMAERTLGHYDAAPAARRDVGPFAKERVRDALGYVPWVPPVAGAAARAVPGGVATAAARMALRWRRTLPGRVLYALAPAGLVDALKARLP
jgi:glycosyltransferase involved in cell wall biosynthesis